MRLVPSFRFVHLGTLHNFDTVPSLCHVPLRCPTLPSPPFTPYLPAILPHRATPTSRCRNHGLNPPVFVMRTRAPLLSRGSSRSSRPDITHHRTFTLHHHALPALPPHSRTRSRGRYSSCPDAYRSRVATRSSFLYPAFLTPIPPHVGYIWTSRYHHGRCGSFPDSLRTLSTSPVSPDAVDHTPGCYAFAVCPFLFCFPHLTTPPTTHSFPCLCHSPHSGPLFLFPVPPFIAHSVPASPPSVSSCPLLSSTSLLQHYLPCCPPSCCVFLFVLFLYPFRTPARIQSVTAVSI